MREDIILSCVPLRVALTLSGSQLPLLNSVSPVIFHTAAASEPRHGISEVGPGHINGHQVFEIILKHLEVWKWLVQMASKGFPNSNML